MKVSSNIVATEAELAELGIDLEKLQEDLTLPNPEYQNRMRFGNGRLYKKIDPTICYLRKIGGEYIVPRYYIGEIGKYGNEGRDIDLDFKFKLRNYQQEFWDANFHCLDESTGILLEAACGSGKTILGIYIAVLRGKQTLVLVPTYYLAKQWKQRIEEATNGSCVILTAKDTEIPVDADFTVVVTDLFTCRELPKALCDNIGLVILDEAHRMGAETYLPILDEIPAKYRLALTATFRRADNVHKILAYHFGLHLKMASNFPKPSIYIVKTNVKIRGVISKNKKYERFLDFMDAHGGRYTETKSAVEFVPDEPLRSLVEEEYKKGSLTKTAYHEITACIKRAADMAFPTVDSYLNEHSGRRKTAIRVIQDCLDMGRTVLFLSKRKDTLKALHKYFAKYKPVLIVSETNARTEEEERYLQKDCQLIFGVTQLAKEGLDIDRLDTLIIHLPIKDTEQAVGRISRLYEGKKSPVCLYLLDDCPMTYAVYRNAKKFFSINGEFKGEVTLKDLYKVL